MELYHIHRINEHGNYEVGQILHPGTAFNSMHESFLNLSSSFPATTKEINGKTINYMTRFDEYLGKVMESDNISPEELKKILLFARSYTLNSSINTREMILEEVRRESYPTLPSRYSCIWLTDDDSFFHWLQELKSGKKEICTVEVNGNLFLSADSLLPSISIPNDEMYKQAHKYWNPDPEYLKTATDREYLFEGELKIIKKFEWN